MPRKKKAKKKNDEINVPKLTYHKSKNGRYYKKKLLPSGKSQCRFCSKSEAEDGMVGSSEPPRKKRIINKKQPVAKPSDT